MDEEQLPTYALGPFVDGALEQLGVLECKIRQPENFEWFRNLWENNAPYHEWFDLAKEIKPDLTPGRWYDAWSNRTILHENFDQAVVEFANALWGWY